jgi:hypothetical protein
MSTGWWLLAGTITGSATVAYYLWRIGIELPPALGKHGISRSLSFARDVIKSGHVPYRLYLVFWLVWNFVMGFAAFALVHWAASGLLA